MNRQATLAQTKALANCDQKGHTKLLACALHRSERKEAEA